MPRVVDNCTARPQHRHDGVPAHRHGDRVASGDRSPRPPAAGPGRRSGHDRRVGGDGASGLGRRNTDHRLHPAHDRALPNRPAARAPGRERPARGLDGGRGTAGVLPGAEIALSYLPELDDEELRLASVGGRRWLLVEMPFQGGRCGWPHGPGHLEIRGYGVILAHPERAEAVQRAPDRMRDIMGRGPLVQVTAGSLTRRARVRCPPRRRGAAAPGGSPLPGVGRPLRRALAPAGPGRGLAAAC